MLDFLTDEKYNADMRRCNMAKMGRPKSEEPMDKKISVRFTQKEYSRLVAYARLQNITVTQAVKSSVMEKIVTEQE